MASSLSAAPANVDDEAVTCPSLALPYTGARLDRGEAGGFQHRQKLEALSWVPAVGLELRRQHGSVLYEVVPICAVLLAW